MGGIGYPRLTWTVVPFRQRRPATAGSDVGKNGRSTNRSTRMSTSLASAHLKLAEPTDPVLSLNGTMAPEDVILKRAVVPL